MKARGCKNYLIIKNLQLGLTARFLFLTVIFALFISYEGYITIWPVVSEVIPRDLSALVKHQVFFRLCLFTLPVLFVIVAFSIVFSHRIAGPLYRIEKTLDDFIAGKEVEPIRLRRGDELKELASKINQVIEKNKKKE